MTDNALNLFISYSHKDEEYFEEFKKHLITLKRNNVIHDYDDLKLIPGDTVDDEIMKMLEKADIIAFLISIDFLNSEYCYEIELKHALSRLENGEIRILPIIIRQCKWQDSIFKSYLSATKNGNPVSKYTDHDEAWCEVVDNIKRLCTRINDLKKQGKKKDNDRLKLTDKHQEFLSDTEIVFRHRFKEKIHLEDIYVYPDLRENLQDLNKISKSFDASSLHKDNIKRALVIGDEQSGKTALAKITCTNLYKNKDSQPIFIDCHDINKVDVVKILEKHLANQYIDIEYNDFINSGRKKTLILDNFESIKLNIKFQKILFDDFESIFDHIYVFSNLYIRFNESRYVDLPSYKQYEILPFNNLKRGELIEKWNALGQEEVIDAKSLHNANDWITYNVDGIVRKNILPAKPMYILSVIQHLDSSKTNDYSLTSYGHCYQSLIQKSLEQSNIKADELDQFINYLSELSYYIFLTRREFINKQQLEEFKTSYSNKYIIISHDYILKSLITSGIIKNNDDSYKFSYRYIFYFYVAKYISEHLDNKICKSEITRLCENIHTEKNSNILIFLVHHSKDQYIIDEILLHAEINFDKYPAAKLDKTETKYLEGYVRNLPDLVIEQRNIDDERRKKLITKDMADNTKEEDNYSDIDFNEQEEKNELSGTDKTFSEVNTSIRLTEIIGQILRNRHGSLTKDQLKDLTLAAYESGLKFLSYFINETESNQEHIINIIQNLIRKNASKSNEQITKLAREFFLFVCYTIIYSVLNKIKESIGTNKLMPIFEEITVENKESPAIQLLQIAIHLEFKKEIPRKEIEQFYSIYKNDQIIIRLVQEVVIQHLYLNHIDHAERQWLSSKLGLPIETQRRIQDNMKLGYKTI